MHIPVSIPNATVVFNVYLEDPSSVHALEVEQSLNTLRECSKNMALVINTTLDPVKFKQSICIVR